jgi:plasmid stabilization system protein ParE
MKYRVQLSARAEQDVDDVLAWLCQQGARSVARRWYEQLLTAVGTLQHEPRRCPLAPEAEDLALDLRERLFGRRQGVYRILFVVEKRTVHVLHIRHSARDMLGPDDLCGEKRAFGVQSSRVGTAHQSGVGRCD